jgi:predicted NBD/HSP70 family sugar kinase
LAQILPTRCFDHAYVRESSLSHAPGESRCLEAYVSAAALVREYGGQQDDPAIALEISRLALAGDPRSLAACSALAGHLAEGVANIFNVLDPQAVIPAA